MVNSFGAVQAGMSGRLTQMTLRFVFFIGRRGTRSIVRERGGPRRCRDQTGIRAAAQAYSGPGKKDAQREPPGQRGPRRKHATAAEAGRGSLPKWTRGENPPSLS